MVVEVDYKNSYNFVSASFMPWNDEQKRASFLNQEDANIWILQQKTIWIKTRLNNYIYHSKYLYERGDRSFYRSIARVNSLDRCILFNTDVQKTDKLKKICELTQKILADMRNILPAPGNSSYASSETAITEITVFIKKEIDNNYAGKSNGSSVGS